MKRFFGCLLGLLLALSIVRPSYAAMTIAVERSQKFNRNWSAEFIELKYTITSTDGTATGTSGAVASISGIPISLQVVPDGSNAPDAAWDATLVVTRLGTSSDGLEGKGANLPAVQGAGCLIGIVDSTSSLAYPLFDDTVQLSVTNFNTSGAASAVVYIYIMMYK